MTKFAKETWLSRRQAEEIIQLRKENTELRERLEVLEPKVYSKPKTGRTRLSTTDRLKILTKAKDGRHRNN